MSVRLRPPRPLSEVAASIEKVSQPEDRFDLSTLQLLDVASAVRQQLVGPARGEAVDPEDQRAAQELVAAARGLLDQVEKLLIAELGADQPDFVTRLVAKLLPDLPRPTAPLAVRASGRGMDAGEWGHAELVVDRTDTDTFRIRAWKLEPLAEEDLDPDVPASVKREVLDANEVASLELERWAAEELVRRLAGADEAPVRDDPHWERP